jgi:hypothetical protein
VKNKKGTTQWVQKVQGAWEPVGSTMMVCLDMQISEQEEPLKLSPNLLKTLQHIFSPHQACAWSQESLSLCVPSHTLPCLPWVPLASILQWTYELPEWPGLCHTALSTVLIVEQISDHRRNHLELVTSQVWDSKKEGDGCIHRSLLSSLKANVPLYSDRSE